MALLLLSCSTTSATGGAPGGATATGGRISCSNRGGEGGGEAGAGGLNLPATIDIQLCAELVDDGTTTRSTECLVCCMNGGFDDGTFLYNRQCTCGDQLPGDSEVCAAADSSAACKECCTKADFGMSGWGGNCTCSDKHDTSVCACAPQGADPAQACANCCLEHGYLGMTYSAIGNECGCG